MFSFLFIESLPDGSFVVFKFTRETSSTWTDCLKFARKKFEKYFLHKALRLLHHFPPETETNSGKFWSHPKKVPSNGIVFSVNNELHMNFVRTLARCWAHLWGIQVSLKYL